MLRILAIAALATSAVQAAQRTPRDAFNDGVTKLGASNLREAEGAFVEVARGGSEALQPGALYNLGHVRFLQGKETLKGEGNREQLARNTETALDAVSEATRNAERVVEGDDLQEIVSAYMFGRAARKQLRGVRDETTRAAGLLESTRGKWKRSIDDFRGANELQPANTDASFNADVVERHLAELEKQLKRCEDCEGQMAGARAKLNELMKKLRAKIPKEMQRESDGEEDEDEDEDKEQQKQPPKPQDKPAGQQQQRIGGERQIHPDMLRILKELIAPRTMSVGQQPQEQGGGQPGEMPNFQPGGRFDPNGQGPGGLRRGDEQGPGAGRQENPRGRKGKDW